MVIHIPLDPYWSNAAAWWVANERGGIDDYYQWMENQGVIGLPRENFTDYLEFINPYQALIFRIKWA